MLLFFALQGIISSSIGIAITDRKTNTTAHEMTIIGVGIACIAVCMWLWYRYQPEINPNAPGIFRKYPMLVPCVSMVCGISVGVLLTVWFSY